MSACEAPAGIAVMGTDTGVGKTVVSLLVLRLLLRHGCDPFYVKPFQTGCRHASDLGSDALFVHRHLRAWRRRDPAQSVIYCHPAPKAPWFAARQANDTIRIERVRQAVAALRRQWFPLVVEAAGGLLVPITASVMMAELAPVLGCVPLLVARAGLGTINHTLLSVEALRTRKIMPFGVVLVETSAIATDPVLAAENRDAIAHFSGVTTVGPLPYLEDFSCPAPAAEEILEGLFNSNSLFY